MSGIDFVRKLMGWGPVFFGVGFLAPLIAQTLAATETPLPGALSPIAAGLLIGAALGLIARMRGRWV